MPLAYSLTLGGVTPHERALLSFQQRIEPLGIDSVEVAGAGLTYWRRDWAKSRIVVECEGWVPPNFAAVNFSASLTLTLKTLDSIDSAGNGTWTAKNFTVYCQPPTVTGQLADGRFTWRIDAIEASASVTVARSVAFSLGGVTPGATTKFTLSRTLQTLSGGRVLVRRASGAAAVRQLWVKRAIVVAGSGWAVPDFSTLDFSAALALGIGGESYSVIAEPLRATWDLQRSAWDWSLACEEA